MAMANDLTNSMGSSAMSDVYTSSFHISSALLVICKVKLVRSTFACTRACSNVEYLTPNFCLIREVRFLSSYIDRFCHKDGMRLISGVR